MPKKKNRELTPKQKKFCDYYVVHLDATRAAKEAGYSEKTASVLGYQLLQNPLLQIYISKRMESLSKRIEVTQEMIVNELRKIAFGDLRSVSQWNAGGVEIKASTFAHNTNASKNVIFLPPAILILIAQSKDFPIFYISQNQ